jgi:hypothetical protein
MPGTPNPTLRTKPGGRRTTTLCEACYAATAAGVPMQKRFVMTPPVNGGEPDPAVGAAAPPPEPTDWRRRGVI